MSENDCVMSVACVPFILRDHADHLTGPRTIAIAIHLCKPRILAESHHALYQACDVV
jgi:hypothetical protein